MEDYNQIIDSIGVKYHNVHQIEILKPVTVSNFYDIQNTIILVGKGGMSFGTQNEIIRENELAFIPSGKLTNINYGTKQGLSINNEQLTAQLDHYFLTGNIDPTKENITLFSFDAKVYESVNFFQSIDIPPFKITDSPLLVATIRELLNENEQNRPGKERIIKITAEKIVIGIIRYVLEHHLFTEQLATNVNYFKDPRLLNIFTYIKENIGGDLSNKTLSNVANVSEDYVGQYFKMLTGINPQDYIEYQRMEQAVEYLRTSKKSIKDIAEEIGYKDTAYFCRRFKMMFGLPAGKMRKRETISNF